MHRDVLRNRVTVMRKPYSRNHWFLLAFPLQLLFSAFSFFFCQYVCFWNVGVVKKKEEIKSTMIELFLVSLCQDKWIRNIGALSEGK